LEPIFLREVRFLDFDYQKNEMEALKLGTRGVYGFRYQNQDKLTYNHFDSYPSFLGSEVCKFVQSTSADQMRAIFPKIVLVSEELEDVPSRELQKKYRKYCDKNVSTQSAGDWYCLLRETQGDLEVYKLDVCHMIDFNKFIKDSLFCEYGYILNLDEEVLEFWVGIQKNPDPTNRYGTEKTGEYYPCRLVGKITFADVCQNRIEESVEIMQELKEREEN
jgi:hypothetical protein